MTLAIGTRIKIRENYTYMYKIFGGKGKIVGTNTKCKQYTQTERTEYYDVECISMLSMKMEIIPVKKAHAKEIATTGIRLMTA